MTTIKKENGQIFEIFNTQSEAVEMIKDCFKNNKEWLSDDDTLYIRYKDGSSYYLSEGIEEGSFKRIGLELVIISNGSTNQLFGTFEIVQNEKYGDWDVIEK
jgi:hypothetical protein